MRKCKRRLKTATRMESINVRVIKYMNRFEQEKFSNTVVTISGSGIN